MTAVLVLREKKYHATTRRSLKPLKAHLVSPYRFIARRTRVVSGRFDFALISSAQTLRYLKKIPDVGSWVFVGEASARSLKDRRAKKVILKNSQARGILEFFRKQKPARIFFPRSAEADPALVKKLRAQGHHVTVIYPYGIKYLRLRRSVLSLMKRKEIAGIFLSSPSCFKSLRRSFSVRELKAWKLKWVGIGPSTAASVRAAGLSVIQSPEPSLESMRRSFLG
jgi:uroporphyrinogen-III synthase